MAGEISNTATFWNVGETQGRSVSWGLVSIPDNNIGAGSATPSAAPLDLKPPIYQDTDNDDLFVWTGATWIGPYAKKTA